MESIPGGDPLSVSPFGLATSPPLADRSRGSGCAGRTLGAYPLPLRSGRCRAKRDGEGELGEREFRPDRRSDIAPLAPAAPEPERSRIAHAMAIELPPFLAQISFGRAPSTENQS